MTVREFKTTYQHCGEEEIDDAERELIESAKAACATAYAPYSNFCVGAAVRLANGVIVSGSNQENAAYPSGICAERCAIFSANSQYPQQAITALAIAARQARAGFVETPVTPCGACRQVLIEAQQRFNTPIKVLLYGTSGVYIINDAADLLPLHFIKE